MCHSYKLQLIRAFEPDGTDEDIEIETFNVDFKDPIVVKILKQEGWIHESALTEQQQKTIDDNTLYVLDRYGYCNNVLRLNELAADSDIKNLARDLHWDESVVRKVTTESVYQSMSDHQKEVWEKEICKIRKEQTAAKKKEAEKKKKLKERKVKAAKKLLAQEGILDE